MFHLLLGDADPAVVGDEIRGATVEQAMLAMTELGRLHAPLLGDTAMADAEWLNRESPMNQALIAQLYAGFVERYGDQIAPEHREVCERSGRQLRRLHRKRRRGASACTGLCTATTGWTTCCSASPAPTGR